MAPYNPFIHKLHKKIGWWRTFSRKIMKIKTVLTKMGQSIAREGKRKYSDLAGPAGVIQSCEREGGEGGDVVHST